jgi:hypothetical protein
MSHRDEEPELTVKTAVSNGKAVLKFFSYGAMLVTFGWTAKSYLDDFKSTITSTFTDVKTELRELKAAEHFKASTSDVNHAFKALGDNNRDLVHKDGTFGILVPELVVPPLAPESGPPQSWSARRSSWVGSSPDPTIVSSRNP